MIKKISIGIVMCIIIFFLIACDKKKEELNFKWSDITTVKYRNDENVNYIIAIKYISGYNASVLLYEKDRNNKNTWSEILHCDGIVGKNGIGKTKEGDNLAPIGDFSIGEAFGIKDNPGTKLSYININDDIYACEDENFYNNIIDIKEKPHTCSGEHMIEYSPEYNYGFKIMYNDENKIGIGSSIFLHCKGAKAYTGGCIAVDEENMKKILQTIDNKTRVVINFSE